MTELREGSIIFSVPSGSDGVDYLRSTLSPRDEQALRTFGSVLGHFIGDDVETSVHYPPLPMLAKAAGALFSGPDFKGRAAPIGQELSMDNPFDTIKGRDAIYKVLEQGTLSQGGRGVRIVMATDPLARVILCGHQGLSRNDAEMILATGVVAMGFRAVVRTRRQEGLRGKVLAEEEQVRFEMTSLSSDPEELSFGE